MIVAGIVAKFGLGGLALVDDHGRRILLLIMGLTGLGSAVKFIPRPVTIGFTNGIALLIASTQIKDFLRSHDALRSEPSSSAAHGFAVRPHWHDPSGRRLALPGTFAARSFCYAAIHEAHPRIDSGAVGRDDCRRRDFHLPVETIGSKFGGIPQGFPHFVFPEFQAAHDSAAAPFGIDGGDAGGDREPAVGGGCGRDERATGTTPTSSWSPRELRTSLSPLFGGIPATGAIARTATNIRSGARTPIAGIVHALTLLAILLVAAPLARFVPLATLAAVLFVVAYNMGEWHEIRTILRLRRRISRYGPRPLPYGAGRPYGCRGSRDVAGRAAVHPSHRRDDHGRAGDRRIHCRTARRTCCRTKSFRPYVTILRIHGPFLFGTTEKADGSPRSDLSAICRRCRDPAIAEHDGARCDRSACA